MLLLVKLVTATLVVAEHFHLVAFLYLEHNESVRGGHVLLLSVEPRQQHTQVIAFLLAFLITNMVVLQLFRNIWSINAFICWQLIGCILPAISVVTLHVLEVLAGLQTDQPVVIYVVVGFELLQQDVLGLEKLDFLHVCENTVLYLRQ